MAPAAIGGGRPRMCRSSCTCGGQASTDNDRLRGHTGDDLQLPAPLLRRSGPGVPGRAPRLRVDAARLRRCFSGGPARARRLRCARPTPRTALNGLVAAAASRKVEFELRDDPPSVGVVGETSPLLVATPEDAAAYAKPWETGAPLRPPAVPACAGPPLDGPPAGLLRAVPVPPPPARRAGPLAPGPGLQGDLRRGQPRRAPGGSGVTTSLVSPRLGRMATGLREAALVPSGRNPREEVAVEGRWRGTIEDPDIGAYRFEVRFTRDGAGVEGSLTAWRGEIEARSPLRDIRYRGRHPQASSPACAARTFSSRGTLDDSQITGTVRAAGAVPGDLLPAVRGVGAMAHRVRPGLEWLARPPRPGPGSSPGPRRQSRVDHRGPRARLGRPGRRCGKPSSSRSSAPSTESPPTPRTSWRWATPGIGRAGFPSSASTERPASRPRRCWPGSTRSWWTCRTWARGTTPTSTRCSTSSRPALETASASSSSTAPTLSGARPSTGTSSTRSTARSSGCTRWRSGTG